MQINAWIELAALLFSIKLMLELASGVRRLASKSWNAIFNPKMPKQHAAADLRRIAYHEAGHAVFQWFTAELATVDYVTIVPSLTDGGRMQPRDHESNAWTEEHYRAGIACSLAGRAAEEVAGLGHSCGIFGDIEAATAKARLMVTGLGMNERVGLINLDVDKCSDATLRVVEEEIVRITASSYATAKRCLDKHREGLDAVAKALLKHETLYTGALCAILGPRPAK